MKNRFTPPKLITFTLSLFFCTYLMSQISFQEQNIRKDIFSGIVCGVVDINGDYYDDLLVLDQAKSLWLGINNGKAYFFWKKLNYTSSQALWSIAVADLDRNGKNDIILGGDFYGVQIFYQDQEGFRRDTIESSVFYSQASTLYDINKDGWVDFTVCDDNAKTRIFENKSGQLVNNFSWVDLSRSEKINEEGNYGCLWSDLDQDGDGDLYISKCSAKAKDRTDQRRINLYYEHTDSSFTERANELGIASNEQSWTSVSGDINGDGRFDLIVANHFGPMNIYVQTMTGQFEDHTIEAGIQLNSIPFQLALEDWDNDGDLDLLSVGSEVEMWLNDGLGIFHKVELDMENPNFTSLSWGDLDEDGRIDIYASYAGLINNPSIARDKLWLNRAPKNHWITLGLNGKSSNENGIGAIVYIHTGNKVQIRELQSGSSYGLQKSLNVHFGLGNYNKIDSIFIHWPSGIVDRFFDFPTDEFFLAGEGSCITPRTKINPRGVVNLCLGEEIELSSYINYDALQWNTGSNSDTIKIRENGAYFYSGLNRFNCPIVSENTTLLVDPVELIRLNVSGEKVLCQGESFDLKTNGYSDLKWNTKEEGATINVNKQGVYFAKFEGLCKDFYSDSLFLKFNDETILPICKADTLLGPGLAQLHSDQDKTLWYNTKEDTFPLAEGKNYETEKISKERSFFARTYTIKEYTPITGGMKLPINDGSLYPGNFLNPNMYFEAYRNFSLDSISVFTDTEGERTFEIKLRGDTNVIQSISHHLIKGMNRIYLGFNCVANKLYSLGTNSAMNITNLGFKSPRLERSNLGIVYPFLLSDVSKISSSEFGDTYYYSFFDWKIRPENNICYSDFVEIPVVILTTQVNQKNSKEIQIIYQKNKKRILILNVEKNPIEMLLFNSSGQIISNVRNEDSFENLALVPGIYFISMNFSDGSRVSKKLVILD
ncbi:MAG: CRTAC1 family protein [Saprospiraceae bacterium]